MWLWNKQKILTCSPTFPTVILSERSEREDPLLETAIPSLRHPERSDSEALKI